MSRILILGGYGGFGARLSRRLAKSGHEVLVAGRSAVAANAFCATCPGAVPVVADRNGDLSTVLRQHRPALLIDAAGPFQGSGYGVPRACIAAGVPYLDLADARDFVSGINSLDDQAKASGVAVIAGASSVPALSGAVARRLAEGIDTVHSVEMAISASNRATSGRSVAAAILSYVGRPLKVWRGRHWTHAFGWQELRRVSFEFDGKPPLRNRWVALADVPDLDSMPDMLHGRPAVTFRAGTDIALQTLGLWLLSWPLRWFGMQASQWMVSLVPPLQRLSRSLGSDRSAMSVTLVGRRLDGKVVERRWTLIAENGDGPEIPTLAAQLLVEEIVAGRIAPGASAAGRLLELAQFEPLFAGIAVAHATVETEMPPPLYQRVMGARFAYLPDAVREMHVVHRDAGASGEARVGGAANAFGRLVARIMRFPPEGIYPLHVAFTERDGVETWTREFGPHGFTSHLSQSGEHLVERFGPMRFRFDLPPNDRGLTMRMRGWSVFGIPLPLALAPRSEAREWEEGSRFHFDVPIDLPVIGRVVHYRGWLGRV